MKAQQCNHRRESTAAQHSDPVPLKLEHRLALFQAAALNVVNSVGSEASIVIVTLLAVMMEPPVLLAGGATAALVFCHWIGSSDD